MEETKSIKSWLMYNSRMDLFHLYHDGFLLQLSRQEAKKFYEALSTFFAVDKDSTEEQSE